MILGNALTGKLRLLAVTGKESYVAALERIVNALDEAAARNAAGELSAADFASVAFASGLGDCEID